MGKDVRCFCIPPFRFYALADGIKRIPAEKLHRCVAGRQGLRYRCYGGQVPGLKENEEHMSRRSMYISIIGAVMLVVAVVFAIRAKNPVMQTPDFGRLSVEGVGKMSMLEKMQAQHYFRAHSLEFPATFSARHPGPYWLLKRKSKFNFSDAQMRQEEDLKLGMAKSTVDDEAALQKAYAVYASDSARLNPSVEQITADIDAVGKAQTSLAAEMVVYHVKSYELLNADQKKTYQRLVAEALK